MRTVFLLLASVILLRAQVPRPAPELKIVEASGKTTMLSSYRGRVVLLAFVSTQCPHCKRISGVFEQLAHEFPGKLQVAEVAFNEGADTTAFVKSLGLSFPVGTTTSEQAHDWLGLEHKALMGTPQVVVIDRAGVIRAQSERLGTPMLQTSEYLSSLLPAVFKLGVSR